MLHCGATEWRKMGLDRYDGMAQIDGMAYTAKFVRDQMAASAAYDRQASSIKRNGDWREVAKKAFGKGSHTSSVSRNSEGAARWYPNRHAQSLC